MYCNALSVLRFRNKLKNRVSCYALFDESKCSHLISHCVHWKNWREYFLAVFLCILLQERNLYLDDYNFYWSPSLGYRDRLIIPFYHNKKIVGFTARTFLPNKRPKYLSNQQPGYVFNFDEQRPEKIFVIVCEGPIDAIHVEGVAVLGSEIKDQQVAMINSLNKQVIVVPDKDKAGSKMIETALEQGWSVSMPDWGKDINDIGDCVKQHGKLYTLYSIVNNSESSKLKIQLREKQWLK